MAPTLLCDLRFPDNVGQSGSLPAAYVVISLTPELGNAIRRTIERRVRFWRAVHGEEQEVIFRQAYKPGRARPIGFTKLGSASLTIAGQQLDHRPYLFRSPICVEGLHRHSLRNLIL